MFIACYIHLTNSKWENITFDQKTIVTGDFSIPVIPGFHGLHFCLVFLVLPIERNNLFFFHCFATASVTDKEPVLVDQGESEKAGKAFTRDSRKNYSKVMAHYMTTFRKTAARILHKILFNISSQLLGRGHHRKIIFHGETLKMDKNFSCLSHLVLYPFRIPSCDTKDT